MKHYITFFLLIALLFSCIPSSSYAVSPLTEDIIYLDNGDYIVVELSTLETRAVFTKTVSRTYTYTANNGDIEWKATITGTFSYTGVVSSCTEVSCYASIINDAWYQISKTTSRSGSSALAEVTMGRKILGIKVDEEILSMKLTCDANGNIS